LGVDPAEDGTDGAVFSSGVHSLDDDKQAVLVLGPHDVLQLRNALDHVLEEGSRLLLVSREG